MRPGRGAAQHLARKHDSRGGRAHYLGDPQTGRLPTWPDRIFITIASIRITGIHRIQGPGPDWCGSIDLDLRAFAPRCRCRTDQAGSPVPYWLARRGAVALIPSTAESAAHHRETVNPRRLTCRPSPYRGARRRRLEQACSRAADRFQRVFGEVGDYRCGNRLGVGPHGKLRRFARYER
jgi:hypothetical protein